MRLGLHCFHARDCFWQILFTNLVLWLLLLGLKLSSWNFSTGNFRICGFVEWDGVYRKFGDCALWDQFLIIETWGKCNIGECDNWSTSMQSMIQIDVSISLNFNWTSSSFCILTPILKLRTTIFRIGKPVEPIIDSIPWMKSSVNRHIRLAFVNHKYCLS
jgi:hypothetical protein